MVRAGHVVVAESASVSNEPVRSHCISTASGSIEIGQRTVIGHGAAISSSASVSIGDDVTIGSFVIIMDQDFHVAGDASQQAVARPVRIGHDCRIGHGVTLMPGAHVGDGATVRSGSVVAGRVEAGTDVSGNPARLGFGDVDDDDPLVAIVRRVAERSVVDPGERLDLDSLATLRMVLEIEERIGARLEPEDLVDVVTLADLQTVVGRKTPTSR